MKRYFLFAIPLIFALIFVVTPALYWQTVHVSAAKRPCHPASSCPKKTAPTPTATATTAPTPTATATIVPTGTYPSGIKHVFVIVMENHDWSQIQGNTSSAPYINTLLTRPDASYASNYHNVTTAETQAGYLHPSEPNYLWLEAGTNSFADHTFTNDNDPSSSNDTTSTDHLSTLLQGKGLSWKAYEESMPSGCPITSSGNYAAKHDPFVFFTDVSGNPPSSTNAACASHVVPFSTLASDVQNNTLPSYSYITPNLCDDMHSNSCTGSSDPIHQGDAWLSTNLPTILNSTTYKNDGAVFITWDEDSGSTTNNPIGMIVLSPLAKGNGYTNTTLYSHSSFVRTVETIFGLSPLLAHAASATDLANLFRT
jgi:phosphatidylinositol-3-phosphatase